MLAVTINRIGYHTAVLNADVTGLSIRKAFGIKERQDSAIKRSKQLWNKRSKWVNFEVILLPMFLIG